MLSYQKMVKKEGNWLVKVQIIQAQHKWPMLRCSAEQILKRFVKRFTELKCQPVWKQYTWSNMQMNAPYKK